MLLIREIQFQYNRRSSLSHLISNQLTINNNFLSKASIRFGLIYAKNEAFAEQQ